MNKINPTYLKIICILAFVFSGLPSHAQKNEGDIYVKGNLLIIKFDTRKPEELQHMLQSFGLNEDSVFNFGSIGNLQAEGWYIYKRTKRYCKIARPVSQGMDEINWGSQPIFFNGNFSNPEIPGYPKPVKFGVNHFSSSPSVYKNEKEEAVFILKNFPIAKSVYLSGNFNNWSTSITPMTQTDSGWVAVLPLEAGKYYYKFIVDGAWYYDENNLQKTDDGYEGFNSTYFHTNYSFELKDDVNFKEVFIAGNFNQWEEKEIALQFQNDKWSVDIYLSEGTHMYKFIADKTWMLDPSNPISRPDGNGNFNSSISIGTPQYFALDGYLNAKKVILTGNFNNWSNAELEMHKTDSSWEISYVLAPGNYAYKFIVDGTFLKDPKNPIEAGDSINGNSFISIFPNYTFVCDSFLTAHKMYLSGSFNDWAEPGYQMKKINNQWSISLYLPVGKYQYKFIADGIWYLDPSNSMVEENEHGTGNSILWIDGNQQFYRK